RPPVSTLFPYTTLFRSSVVFFNITSIDLDTFGNHLFNGEERMGLSSGKWTCDCRQGRILIERMPSMQATVLIAVADELLDQRVEDRKSTRLNSSHVEIS